MLIPFFTRVSTISTSLKRLSRSSLQSDLVASNANGGSTTRPLSGHVHLLRCRVYSRVAFSIRHKTLHMRQFLLLTLEPQSLEDTTEGSGVLDCCRVCVCCMGGTFWRRCPLSSNFLSFSPASFNVRVHSKGFPSFPRPCRVRFNVSDHGFARYTEVAQ